MKDKEISYENYVKAIKDQGKYSMPFGIFLSCMSITMLDSILGYLFLLVGIGFVAISILSERRRTPKIFLLNFITMMIMMATMVLQIINDEGWKILNIVILFLLTSGAIGSIKQYFRYKNIQIDDSYEETDKRTNYFLVVFKYFGLFVLIGITIVFYNAPPAGVLNISQLSPEHIDYFKASGFLVDPDEKILLAYFDGVIDFKDSGGLLTNKKLIVFSNSDDIDTAIVVYIKDISSVTEVEGTFGIPECIIETVNRGPLRLTLPMPEGDNSKFIVKLKSLVDEQD